MQTAFETSGAGGRDWRISRPLPMLLILGAALRIAWVVSFRRIIEQEGPVYAGIAQRLIEGRTYVDHVGGLQVGFPPCIPS